MQKTWMQNSGTVKGNLREASCFPHACKMETTTKAKLPKSILFTFGKKGGREKNFL